MTPQFIILHTAAHGKRHVVYDTTAAQIDDWHKARGWKGIGYHFVVRRTGEIELGRPTDEKGAHVRGMNGKSLGICFSGHGDFWPLTPEQFKAGLALVNTLREQFGIEADHVIGHREVNDFVAAQYRTSKTCPGQKVDVRAFRVTPDTEILALKVGEEGEAKA